MLRDKEGYKSIQTEGISNLLGYYYWSHSSERNTVWVGGRKVDV